MCIEVSSKWFSCLLDCRNTTRSELPDLCQTSALCRFALLPLELQDMSDSRREMANIRPPLSRDTSRPVLDIFSKVSGQISLGGVGGSSVATIRLPCVANNCYRLQALPIDNKTMSFPYAMRVYPHIAKVKVEVSPIKSQQMAQFRLILARGGEGVQRLLGICSCANASIDSQ